ncbi:uncharacterized protein PV09_06536 [Verruconis gallopava]|uniref:1-phosphatidylinositol 4-kinase n=1 Tax=Verruconis gallopava TaxID=253628 RepID=A0A0D2A5P8_9PEZI|nr:uncharacterized protein PV09_06536 [Verruconis gallopava]KIW02033.1 hypothetical protein PV09_06536 [Verruconis gallopava]
MSWNLLERFLESDHFNRDPSLCIEYLSRYAEHVGIHYVLCNKLRQFTYEELEFFLPQLCHLVVSIDNESMALEEFILDLCEESVNSALLTFWLFQTYLHDLSSNPQSVHFKTTRRIYNKVQRIVFGASEGLHREKIKENVLPVTVLASLVLASVAAPILPQWAGPLAVAQSRRPRPTDDVISDAVHMAKVSRSNTVAGTGRPRTKRKSTGPSIQGHSDTEARDRRRSASQSADEPAKSPQKSDPRPGSSKATARSPPKLRHITGLVDEARMSTSSLPDIRFSGNVELPTPPASAGMRPSRLNRRNTTASNRALTPSALTREQKIRMLRSNYFRNETAFLQALEDISNRLVIVPKPARLSALRAELALIAQDLPAEVDIPLICPAVLEDGKPARSKHHRIVRINPAEATSLNSAERVPYLLMVEILTEDFDFDPDTDENQHLLAKILQEKGRRRRLFDITDQGRAAEASREQANEVVEDSVLEPANGDLGNSPLLLYEDQVSYPLRSKSPLPDGSTMKAAMAARSSGATTGARSSLTAISTPRTSNTELSRSSSPLPRKSTIPLARGADQPDVSALATHMRTAAQMLAQLEQSGSKRPKAEVAAIKAKIIASMQTLEEQSFFLEDGNAPTFDTIIAKADSVNTDPDRFDEAIEAGPDPNLNSGAGAARMENDIKTGGVSRRGDRDDPSAATFGEEWSAKKDRIRKSSPYGWMKNWDLVSVIVKTGADLRQEAFACQLIRVCARIWDAMNVPVWVKDMKILVTGESSGLIETITNGVSLHSLKRSLTLASIAANTNPRKRIATLRDHFVKSFGDVDSDSYAAGLDAFKKSLAAYSMISYILQLKDRHNGNILIDNFGHIIHIDFGFMLSNSPGSMGFEAAPFKLTQEYIDVLGGVGSPGFEDYKSLCKQAFQALRKHAEKIVMLVEVMGKGSKMPCFSSGVGTVVNSLRARFVLHLSREEADAYVEELIQKSAGSYYTRLYDTFQYRTQGIY